MTEPIRGKVAQVLSQRELAMNVGSEQGVEEGMKFDVMGSADIRDPDTKEVIGNIERSKLRVRVSYVQEKVAVATTFRKITNGVSFALALMPVDWRVEYETIRASGKTWEEDSRVQIGDPVVQVIE